MARRASNRKRVSKPKTPKKWPVIVQDHGRLLPLYIDYYPMPESTGKTCTYCGKTGVHMRVTARYETDLEDRVFYYHRACAPPVFHGPKELPVINP